MPLPSIGDAYPGLRRIWIGHTSSGSFFLRNARRHVLHRAEPAPRVHCPVYLDHAAPFPDRCSTYPIVSVCQCLTSSISGVHLRRFAERYQEQSLPVVDKSFHPSHQMSPLAISGSVVCLYIASGPLPVHRIDHVVDTELVRFVGQVDREPSGVGELPVVPKVVVVVGD